MTKIIQGDNYAHDFTVIEYPDLSDWNGTWAIVSEIDPGGFTLASGNLTHGTDVSKMQIRMTPDVSETLPIGPAYLIAEITSSDGLIRKEVIQDRAEIKPQGIDVLNPLPPWPVQSTAGDYATPQMFGAMGNGIADDTSAIQLALDSGKPVYIPKPSAFYRTTTTLVSASQTNIRFESEDTAIRMVSGAGFVFQVNGGENQVPDVKHVHIEGGTFSGYDTSAYNPDCSGGIKIKGAYVVTLDRTHCSQFSKTGTDGAIALLLENVFNAEISNSRFNCGTGKDDKRGDIGCKVTISDGSPFNITQVVFTNNLFQFNTRYGIATTREGSTGSIDGITVDNNGIGHNGTAGVAVRSNEIRSVTINNNHIEGEGTYGVSVEYSGTNVNIIDNQIQDAVTSIRHEGKGRIAGNTILGTTTPVAGANTGISMGAAAILEIGFNDIYGTWVDYNSKRYVAAAGSRADFGIIQCTESVFTSMYSGYPAVYNGAIVRKTDTTLSNESTRLMISKGNSWRAIATTDLLPYVTPEMFGGSLQSALDLGNDTPVTVYLKPGTVYDGTGVEITKKYVTVTGGGTISNGIAVNGYVSDVLPGIKLYTVFDGITFKYGTSEPVNDVTAGTTIATGNHGITLHDCANVDVVNCKFFYCDAAVYIPHKTTQQHVNRVKIHGNSIQTCNYVLLSLRTGLATNSPMYNFGDIHVVNNQAYNTQISHIHAEGADGLVCSDNTFFFGPLNTTKMYNIYINFGNWVHIHNNNLFESGRDAVWLNEVQNPNVSGNNIAWPGQWVNSHGIRLTGGGPGGTAANAYTLGTISNNNIMFPSYCGISIEDECGFISITGNQIRSAGDISTGHWLGTDDTGLPHYYIQTGANTTYITHSGNMGSGGPATGNNFLGTGIYQPEEVNIDYHIATVTTATTTLNVKDIHEIRLNDSSTGTITTLTGGISGQEIVIISYQTDKTTITNSAPATDKIRLRNNASRLMGLYESVRLRFMAGTWYEVGGDSASMVTLYAIQTLTNKTLTAPTVDTVNAAKFKITAEGGYAIQLVAGEALAQGEIVYIKTTSGADGKVWRAPTSNDMPIGVVYAAASVNADVWVVVSGIALVKPAAAVTATRGYVMFVSTTTLGTADQSATGGATTEHWRECGHWLDTGSGAAVLTRAVLHFN